MPEITVPTFISVTLGIVMFFLGAFLTRKIAVLGDYNIPEPVSGGLAVTLITWGYIALSGQQITFDLGV